MWKSILLLLSLLKFNLCSCSKIIQLMLYKWFTCQEIWLKIYLDSFIMFFLKIGFIYAVFVMYEYDNDFK